MTKKITNLNIARTILKRIGMHFFLIEEFEANCKDEVISFYHSKADSQKGITPAFQIIQLKSHQSEAYKDKFIYMFAKTFNEKDAGPIIDLIESPNVFDTFQEVLKTVIHSINDDIIKSEFQTFEMNKLYLESVEND